MDISLLYNIFFIQPNNDYPSFFFKHCQFLYWIRFLFTRSVEFNKCRHLFLLFLC